MIDFWIILRVFIEESLVYELALFVLYRSDLHHDHIYTCLCNWIQNLLIQTSVLAWHNNLWLSLTFGFW